MKLIRVTLDQLTRLRGSPPGTAFRPQDAHRTLQYSLAVIFYV
jgi:hypothetical protein